MPLEGFIFYLVVIWLGALLITGAEWVITRLMDKSLAKPRPDTRLPHREYDLMGEDYRDAVADYFHRKATRDRIVRGQ
jgi:hypothetical protein